MRRFLVSLLALALLLFALDRVVGGALARLYRESPSDDGDLLGRGFARRPQLVICGDSRAQNHYVVDSLEAWLKVKAYDFGRGGMSTGYHYGVSTMLLAHETPRVFILEVEPDIYAFKDLADRLSVFLPYASEYPVAVDLSDLRGRYEPLKRVSRMYPYNSLLISLLGDRFGKAPQNRLGYVPLEGGLSSRDAGTEAGEAGEGRGGKVWSPPRDPDKMRYLRLMVAGLKARGVRVLAVRSPEFLRSPAEIAYNNHIERNLASIFRELDVPYMDIHATQYPVFHDPALYRDPVHLNHRGAEIFSRLVADSLKARRWL